MKKLLVASLFILLALIVILPSCSQSTPTPAQTSTAPKPAQTSAAPTSAPASSTAKPSQAATPTAQSGSTITLIYEHKIPSSHNLADNEKAWINAVVKASNGRIKFDEHWGGEPLPADQELVGTGKGVIDIINTVATYHSGEVGIADFTLMPSAFKTPKDMFDLWYKTDMGKIVEKIYRAKSNVTVLYPFANYFGAEVLMMSKKARPIKTVADIKGMKLRGAGGATDEAVKLLGASPVTVVGSEIYNAVQAGTVDGVLLPSYGLQTYKLWEVCNQVIMPPVAPVCTNMMYMNLDAFNKLPADLQKVLTDVAQDYSLFEQQVKYTDAVTQKILDTSTKDYKVQIYTFPAEEATKMYKQIDPSWDFYINNCAKQGYKTEAEQIRKIIADKFYAAN